MNYIIIVVWSIIFLITTGFLFFIGNKINKRYSGVLIDERNKYSLSRFQIVVWTVIVLSAYATACIYNMWNNIQNPLSIAIPEELWLLMGISTTSLVGSPLILSTKTGKPDKKERDRNKRILNPKKVPKDEKQTNKNLIMVNETPQGASVSDMFRGDETGNFAQIDISKVQLFYFTLLLVIVYTVALANKFIYDPGKITEFPPLDMGMIALFGISNAGYLTYKGAKHSITQGEAE